jgi:hypothetical protein
LPEASVFWLACAGIVGCPEAMMTASRKQNHILNNPINAPRGNNCRADFFALECRAFCAKARLTQIRCSGFRDVSTAA